MKGLKIPISKDFAMIENAEFADQIVRVALSDLTNWNPFSRLVGISEQYIFQLPDEVTMHRIRDRIEKVFDFLKINDLAELIDLKFTTEEGKFIIGITYKNIISNKEVEMAL